MERTFVPRVGLLVVLALVAACGRGKRPLLPLRDTEGRSFEARCDPQRGCQVKQTGGPRDPSGRTDLVIHRQSLLTAICNVAAGVKEREDVRDCRALQCDTDRNCPPEPGGPRYGHCVDGFCVDPAGTLQADDSILYCLAGKGLGREAPNQVEAYAIGLNCGSPCTIPRICKRR
ncbi:MAG: hypothetical protein JW751_15800 [Polyangiaceae bacterium]|nr:hypothetical protein [Polyangiaceae bacterium]